MNGDKFLAKIAASLAAMGADAKMDGAMYLVVAGCKFSVEDEKREKGKEAGTTVVRFLGSGFKVTNECDFDISRAIGLIVQELPKRLKIRADQENRVRYATLLKENFGHLPKSKHLNEPVHPSGATLSYSEKGIQFYFTTESVDEVNALLEAVDAISAKRA